MRLRALTLAVVLALAVVAPAARAQVPVPVGAASSSGNLVGPCATNTGGPDAGVPGATAAVCGSGLTFVAPAIGRIESVIGPTIISPGFAGVVTVSGGSAFVGPGSGSEYTGGV